MGQPGVLTRSRVKRTEARLWKERDFAREKCEKMELEMEVLRGRLAELEADETSGADDDGENSTQSSEDEEEPICA